MEEGKARKIFSLNLMVFVMYKTEISPELFYLVENGNGVVYATFPECAAVGGAIKAYKEQGTQVELKKYLNCFEQIRQRIKRMRDGGGAA